MGPPVHVQHGLWPECLQVGQHRVAIHFSHGSIQWQHPQHDINLVELINL